MAYTLLDDEAPQGGKFVLMDDEPTTEQKIRASVPGRILQGARDPIQGLAQTLTHVLPEGLVKTLDKAQNAIAPYTGGLVATVPEGGYDESLRNQEQEYQDARKATGSEGLDVSRFVGNVVSPANLALAKVLPLKAAASVRGAIGGATAALSQPVLDERGQQDFGTTKTIQGVTGAVAGAVLGPIVEKVGGKITRYIGNKFNNPQDQSLIAERSIREALEESGQRVDDLPPEFVMNIRAEAEQALREGRQINPAAIMRAKDFESLGMKPTLGQITRDPTQFANERNLRGVAGGQPLMDRFTQQNQELQRRISGYGGQQAAEPQLAGKQIVDTLSGADSRMAKEVGRAYAVARESTGRDMRIPIESMNDDLNVVLQDFGEHNIPSAIRKRLSEFGLFGGKAEKAMTMNDAEQILQQANKLRTNDPAINRTLGEIKTAIKKAIETADDGGGPFAAARSAASNRFKMQDAIPALKAASDGDVSADNFVRQYLINGETSEVKTLAEFLKRSDPEAFNQARSQIGAEINRAAFGSNIAGDKPLAAERLSDFIRRMGSEKLKAFYSPEEIETLRTAARVGGYIHNIPSGSPVNTSNTASTIANLIQRIPGATTTMQIAGSAVRAVKNQNAVNRALKGNMPSLERPLTEAELETLRQIVNRGSLSSGQLSGRSQ